MTITTEEAEVLAIRVTRPGFGLDSQEKVANALRTLAAERDIANEQIYGLSEERERWKERAERAEAEAERLREALKPSGATKAAYIGEFSFGFPVFDEDGHDVMRNVNVPWTTIKEIMSAIRARAALEGGKDADQQT